MHLIKTVYDLGGRVGPEIWRAISQLGDKRNPAAFPGATESEARSPILAPPGRL